MIYEKRGNLEKLHEIELNILRNVIDICNLNKIRYFIIEGSLLGAVRHNGFIPWDDDIDIGMPREDYERFLNIAPSKLAKNLKLITYNTSKSALRYFSQVECKDIKVRTNAQRIEKERFAWIDIFPLDGMPDNVVLRYFHLLKILALRAASQFSQFDEMVNIQKKDRPFYEKFLIWLASTTKFGTNWDTKKIMQKEDALLKKYDYENSKYIINASSAYKMKAILPKELFGSGRIYIFEGIQLTGPMHYEKILHQLYGDYMTLPPENKRNCHYTEVI